MWGEWKAWLTSSRRVRRPWFFHRSAIAVTVSLSPDRTMERGAVDGGDGDVVVQFGLEFVFGGFYGDHGAAG
ncbi:hypothetical protein, partial [Streptomyces sp. NPDC001076]